jgi:hypothetical protein
METLHNSNTSEDIVPCGLMGLTRETVSDMFEQINTEKGQQKMVNIQPVPAVYEIPSNKITPVQTLSNNVNRPTTSILKQASALIQPTDKLNESTNKPNELTNKPNESTNKPNELTNQTVTIDKQYMKIMSFEISRTTLYFAIGLIALIFGYYYMQHKNNNKKEETTNKIRRGRQQQYNDQYEE